MKYMQKRVRSMALVGLFTMLAMIAGGGFLSPISQVAQAAPQASDPSDFTLDDGTFQSPATTNMAPKDYFTDPTAEPIEGAIEATCNRRWDGEEIDAWDGEKVDKGFISGGVLLQKWGNLQVDLGTEGKAKPNPISGVRVYAQWMQDPGTPSRYAGATSPVYTTVSRTDGSFCIEMKPFLTEKGLVEFDADPNLPEGEKWRIWVELADGSHLTQLLSPFHGGFGPVDYVADTTFGISEIGNNSVHHVAIKFGERIDSVAMHLTDENGAITATENYQYTNPLAGSVGVNTFWNFGYAQGSLIWSAYASNVDRLDIPIGGVKVYGSYLSDYALARIYGEYKDGKGRLITDPQGQPIDEKAESGLDFLKRTGYPGNAIRGAQWTNDWEAILQNWIKQQIAKEGQERWIAETVSGITGDDGKVWLLFKGTYGDSVDYCGSGLDSNKKASCSYTNGAYDYFHKVAENRDDPADSWADSLLHVRSKHLNLDWLFVSTEPVPGTAVTTPFHMNWYGGWDGVAEGNYGTGPGWPGDADATSKGFDGGTTDYATLFGFAFIPASVGLNVFPYDLQNNLAVNGDVAENHAWGLPATNTSGVTYTIVWKNDSGEVVKTCSGLRADATGQLGAPEKGKGVCELPVDGINDPTIFTALLYASNSSGDVAPTPLAADSFLAIGGGQWMTRYSMYGEPRLFDKSEYAPGGATPTTDTTRESENPFTLPITESHGVEGQAGATRINSLAVTPLESPEQDIQDYLNSIGLALVDGNKVGGRPTKSGVYPLRVQVNRTMWFKDADDKVLSATVDSQYIYRLIVTDSPVPEGRVGQAYSVDVADVVEGFETPNTEDGSYWVLKTIDSVNLGEELTATGLSVAGSVISGTPRDKVDANQAPTRADPATKNVDGSDWDDTKGPNLTVTYTLQLIDGGTNQPVLNGKGQAITRQQADYVPLVIRPLGPASATLEATKELRAVTAAGALVDPKELDERDIEFTFELAQDTTSAGCTASPAGGFDEANYFNATPASDSAYEAVKDTTLTVHEGAWVKTLAYGGETDKRGELSFPKMSFSEEGTYCFSLKERPTNVAYITDDTAVRTVVVSVAKNQQGDLEATIAVKKAAGGDGAGEGVSGAEAARFINVWDGIEPPMIPLTGGLSALVYWVCGGLVLAVGLWAGRSRIRELFSTLPSTQRE